MELECQKEAVQENSDIESLHGNGNMNFIYLNSASEMEWIYPAGRA